MKKHFLLTLFTVFFATIWLSGQTLKQYEKAVNEAFAKKDYYAALYYLDIIQEIDSSIIDLQYKQAEAARNFNAYLLAEKRYQQVLSSKQSKDFPLSSLWLAYTQKSLGKYKEASSNFQYYLDTIALSNDEYIEAAKMEIESCQWAISVQDKLDPDVSIQQLGTEINTPYSEFGPFEKDNKLYFSSLRFAEGKTNNAPPKLYSKVIESTQNAPTNIVDLNTEKEKHTAHTAFSKTGDRLYYNLCEYTDGNLINCSLYFKDILEGDTYGPGQKLSDSINVPGYTVTQPSIGYNKESKKETLYFVSDRPGGKGGLDIWYADLDEDGQLGKPVNFELVNTDKDEASPYFHTNTRMFFFSSKGRQNLGGFDLFQVYIDDGVTWEKVEHIGMPLSTSYDDIYFTLTDYGDEGYFASNREGSIILEKEVSACCNDIFKIKLESFPVDLTAVTFNSEMDYPLTDAGVTLYDLSSGVPVEMPFKRLPNGHKHYYRVKSGKEYMIIGQKDNFFPDTILFNTNDVDPGDKLTQKINLAPLGLNVIAYDRIDKYYKKKEPLKNVDVRLWELDEDNNKLKEIASASSKLYDYRLETGKKYRIIADKIGYQVDSLDFDTHTWVGGPILLKEIYLEQDPPEEFDIEAFPTFSLFFDNDSPDPRTLATTTRKTYPITLEEYERQKELYKKGYSRGLTGERRIMAEAEIEEFFESEVKKSYTQFDEFTQAVLERLKLGLGYQIKVIAYSSPLAPERYNLNLSKRRISSMENYYRTYNNGEMAKYVDNGAIEFTMIPHGERLAPSSVSDNPRDRKNSVFSPTAARERRVVIIGVGEKELDSTITKSDSGVISN